MSSWGGLDLGGTKIEAVVTDAGASVLGRARVETPAEGPEAIVQALATALEGAAREAGVETSALSGVGVGAPGAVDASRGVLVRAPNLVGWDKPFPLASELAALVGSPVKLGNDVQVAVDAEFKVGAGRGASSLLGVWWGTGVGGSVVLNGHRWTGRGTAGEFGHTLVREGGAKCGCGRRGCLEAYAGRANMERKARRLMERGEVTRLFQLMEDRGKDRLTSSVWARAYRDGDDVARQLLHRSTRMLGAAMASVVNLLDLPLIVLGGGLGSRIGPMLLDRLEKELHQHLFLPDRPPTLRLAELGDLSGAVGAALLSIPVTGVHVQPEQTEPAPMQTH